MSYELKIVIGHSKQPPEVAPCCVVSRGGREIDMENW